MIRKNYSVFCISFIWLVIIFSIKTAGNDNNPMLKVEAESIPVSGGWGYNILVDHKIFIHQEYIPAITGKKEFCSKAEAMKTAGLVIEKLKRKMPLTITTQDLTALKISF